jgi:hypothetical protein
VAALGLARLVRSDVFDGLTHLLQIAAVYGAATPDRRSRV